MDSNMLCRCAEWKDFKTEIGKTQECVNKKVKYFIFLCPKCHTVKIGLYVPIGGAAELLELREKSRQNLSNCFQDYCEKIENAVNLSELFEVVRNEKHDFDSWKITHEKLKQTLTYDVEEELKSVSANDFFYQKQYEQEILLVLKNIFIQEAIENRTC